MGLRGTALALAATLALAGFSTMATADWLSRLAVLSERAAGKAGVRTAATLEHAGRLLKASQAARTGPALAAEVTAEGHWTFLNVAGERFTAASAEELKRVVPVLAAEAAKPGIRLTLMLTEDAVFKHRQHLQALALASDRRTDLLIAVDREAYPLLRRGERAAERHFAEVRPSLLVELTERRLFDEATWQLAHPLKRSSVRVLALEPGGPAAVPPGPRLDAQSQRALTDTVDPRSLVASLRSLSGQMVILTARRDGERLAFRPSSGPEQTLALKDVLAAAEAADVNIVLLQSATPRQPGTRSWLWQRVSVTRLDDAVGRDHLADFLNALVSPPTKLMVSATEAGGGRIQLRATPFRDDGGGPRTGIGDALSDLVSDIAGRVVVSGVEASLRDSARQHELDRRLVPGIPSDVQFGYLGLLVLGLAGHAVAKGWWSRIWPPESREGYSSPLGYQSARAVRLISYVAVFMPLVAVASAPLAMIRGLVDTLRGLLWLLTWPLRQLGRRAA